jgi:dUTP pyrophosphatase
VINIKIKLLPGAALPEYHSDGSSGADLRAFLEAPMEISIGGVALIPTGVYLEIPEGYEAQIRPRSGLAIEHGVTLLNSPGTIDSDYRGEIKIIMANFGNKTFIVRGGMRIAQMVFARVERARFLQTGELESTGRNEGGFGHSGL